jgi:hypothetical protein
MRKKLLTGILIVLLLNVVVVTEAKPSRTVEKKVFIHKAKGGKPGKPDKPSGGEEKPWYEYSGVHWPGEALPVPYVVDYDLDFSVITDSFETWDTETAEDVFGTGTQGSVEAGNLDGVNALSWGDYPGESAIAITYIWYWSDTGEIVEVDTLFDTDFAWSTGGEPDKMDLQNIATHEFGHWLTLDDLYMKPAKRQTMYGYGSYGETIKRTLESGDIAGIEAIYGP